MGFFLFDLRLPLSRYLRGHRQGQPTVPFTRPSSMGDFFNYRPDTWRTPPLCAGLLPRQRARRLFLMVVGAPEF